MRQCHPNNVILIIMIIIITWYCFWSWNVKRTGSEESVKISFAAHKLCQRVSAYMNAKLAWVIFWNIHTRRRISYAVRSRVPPICVVCKAEEHRLIWHRSAKSIVRGAWLFFRQSATYTEKSASRVWWDRGAGADLTGGHSCCGRRGPW